MDTAVRRNIVVSAVNLRKGGTLTVLRDCLRYLSSREDLHVTALVHNRELCDFPGIDYIVIPWSVRSWGLRLWCEYVTMNGISKRLPETDLWLSLHDTTPRVKAKRQAVYCHTPFPFMKATTTDLKMNFKILLFSRLTKYAYRINVHRNRNLIVQQQWMREGLAELTGFPAERIIVAPPAFERLESWGFPVKPGMTKGEPEVTKNATGTTPVTFLYPAWPDTHKNFETLCQAARILESSLGEGRFKVVITVKGDENRYACWLSKRYGECRSIDFHGFMTRDELYASYDASDCLVFPSRAETWGLPISEFLPTGKPMILADLPYAHETAAGAAQAAFFPVMDADAVAGLMQEVITGPMLSFAPVAHKTVVPQYAADWPQLFDILLDANPSTR